MKGLSIISVLVLRLSLCGSWVKKSESSTRSVAAINWNKNRPRVFFTANPRKKAVNMVRLPRFRRRMPQLWTFELFLRVRLC